jgi:hypothetical protein
MNRQQPQTAAKFLRWLVTNSRDAMPESADQPDSIALVEHCARYASEFGVDNMLDLIVGVHQAYARITNDPVAVNCMLIKLIAWLLGKDYISSVICPMA